MSLNSVTRRVLDISIVVDVEVEDGVIFAKSACPIQGCGSVEDSTDNGYGADYAADLTASKIRTHLILSHGYKDDSEETKKG